MVKLGSAAEDGKKIQSVAHNFEMFKFNQDILDAILKLNYSY